MKKKSLKKTILAKNLRWLRKQKKIKIDPLIKFLNISRQTYFDYEIDASPKIETLIKLAELYNIILDDLCRKDLSVIMTTNQYILINQELKPIEPFSFHDHLVIAFNNQKFIFKKSNKNVKGKKILLSINGKVFISHLCLQKDGSGCICENNLFFDSEMGKTLKIIGVAANDSI